MSFAAARLGQDLLGNQQTKLDADPGESNPLTANFAAGGDIMEAGEVAPLHPEPLSSAVNDACAGSAVNEIALAPESRLFATISVRTVSSAEPG